MFKKLHMPARRVCGGFREVLSQRPSTYPTGYQLYISALIDNNKNYYYFYFPSSIWWIERDTFHIIAQFIVKIISKQQK